jgi:hypothetical protein
MIDLIYTIPKITYLLGAGASAKALPLIKKSSYLPGLSEELNSFIEDNKSAILTLSKWEEKDFNEIILMVHSCIDFGTPDLYAKFLLETGETKKYILLKRLLSMYFCYKEELKNSFDSRAMTFLTTITENQKISENIRIISWNYDSQIEIAARKLKPGNPSGLSTVQGFSSWPNLSDGESNSEIPFIVHLNGIAGFTYCPKDFSKRSKKTFDFSDTQNNQSLLSFAWENENNDTKFTFLNKRIELAKLIAKNTDILVIIGYSFPFFNRIIDKILFTSFSQSLKKIYFQDPSSDGQHLIGMLPLTKIAMENIIHIKQTDNYHIPYEF